LNIACGVWTSIAFQSIRRQLKRYLPYIIYQVLSKSLYTRTIMKLRQEKTVSGVNLYCLTGLIPPKMSFTHNIFGCINKKRKIFFCMCRSNYETVDFLTNQWNPVPGIRLTINIIHTNTKYMSCLCFGID
jgi:hypothetical protein